MYNPKGTSDERDLNLQMFSFFVVKFCEDWQEYRQISNRMSLENAHALCLRKRELNTSGDYKVHGEVENF